MRARLLGALLGLTIGALVLFGVARAFIVADRVEAQERTELTLAAATIGTLSDAVIAGGDVPSATTLAPVLGPGDSARIELPDDAGTIEMGPPIPEAAIRVRHTSPAGAELLLARPAATVEERVLSSVTSVALVALPVVLLAAAGGVVLSTRLARPFSELAAVAERLAEDPADLELPATSVPEAVAIRDALERSARRLAEQIRREREFASNASHQLRTPLTGMRLRLEDMASWSELPAAAREELDAILADVNRLSDTITGLLELSRRGRFGVDAVTDAADAMAEAVRRWGDEARRRDRTLAAIDSPPIQVAAPPGAIDQLLDVLIQNALDHGHGDVELEASRADGFARLRVSDEGDGIPTSDVERIFERRHRGPRSQGHGIGLPLAHDIVTSLGGRLLAATTPPTRFDLLLPIGQPSRGGSTSRAPARQDDVETHPGAERQ